MQQYDSCINRPGLPQNDVSLVAVGSDAINTKNALFSLGIKVVDIQINEKLPSSINSHADLQLLHFGRDVLFCENGNIAGESEKNFDIKLISESLGDSYPNDCLLNCLIIKNNLLCNTKYVSKDVLNYAEIIGLNIVHCNQGYTKCSTCIVNDNCLITDDTSIYKSAQNFLDDVVLISKGSIRLKNMNYGFIGGCTGKIGKNKIAFNGRIDSHSDYKLIIDCLDKYDITAVELINDRLTDIGSIIPLREYSE